MRDSATNDDNMLMEDFVAMRWFNMPQYDALAEANEGDLPLRMFLPLVVS